MSSPRAIARILAAREDPFPEAGGILPLDTILIESFLPLSSVCWRKKRKLSNDKCSFRYKIRFLVEDKRKNHLKISTT